MISHEQLVQTAASIAAIQQPDGGVPWPEGHVDAWNHVECLMAMSVAGRTDEVRRGYAYLLRHQRQDGSWPAKLLDGAPLESNGESNHAAYLAVGLWHELLVTGDEGFAKETWPAVKRALDYVTALQTARGEIVWERDAAGRPADYALLTGSSSIHQGLRAGVRLAERLSDPQPRWAAAADRLAHAIRVHPEAFADKSRFAMDWYYPVLGGAVRGERAAELLRRDWHTFVQPGLGIRCVSDQPWVTGAESCELVLALDAVGDRERALRIFADMQHLRHEDGSYWTGWQFADHRHFPHERSGYTAAAVILAADALYGLTPAAGLFREAAAPEETVIGVDPGACGCAHAKA